MSGAQWTSANTSHRGCVSGVRVAGIGASAPAVERVVARACATHRVASRDLDGAANAAYGSGAVVFRVARLIGQNDVS